MGYMPPGLIGRIPEVISPPQELPTPYPYQEPVQPRLYQPPPPRPVLYDPYSPYSRGWLYESAVSQYPSPPVWLWRYQYTPPPRYYSPPAIYSAGKINPPPEETPPTIMPVPGDYAPIVDKTAPPEPPTTPSTPPITIPISKPPTEEERKKLAYDREYGLYYVPNALYAGIER
ncbi:MAG: hypothetical protein QXT45_08085 [Candidatus Bilamarchaeaceae archaeon]